MTELLSFADPDTLVKWNELHLGYTECKGLPELRRECSVEYPGLNEDNLLFFSGAEEAIYCVFKTILNSCDHVIVITPCYQSLHSIPEALCDVTVVDLNLDSSWELDVQAVYRSIKPGVTKMVIMNFPHNPTGSIITIEQQQQLVTMAKEYDLWLFCDEVYKGIERDHTLSLPPIACVYEKGISLGALSKVYGLAGLRVGWMACSNLGVINAVSENKHYLSICNSAPSELLALIAVKARDKIINRNRSILQRNEELLESFLQRHSKMFIWNSPKGGCCGFMRLRLPDCVDLADVAERLANNFGVLILPGEQFPVGDPQKDLIKKFFRIGLGRDTFPAALAAFEEALPKVLNSLGADISDLW